eukprot:gene10366-2500_t
MRVIACDETGLVKTIVVERGQEEYKWRSQDRATAPIRVCFAQDTDHEIYLGLADKSLERLNIHTGVQEKIGTDICEGYAGLCAKGNRLYTCSSSGIVTLRSYEDTSIQTEFKAHSQCNCMKVGLHNKHIVAVGGEDCDLRIWDVSSTKSPVFKAKNVKNDMLNLQVPVNIRDIAFVPNTDDKVVVTVSAHRHLRVYDTRVKARPIYSEVRSEAAFNCLAVTNDGKKIITGNSLGHAQLFDFATKRILGNFHGPVGAVRDIALHPTLPVVALCGLDRHVRVYDIQNRSPISKTFLKQRQSCILFTNEGQLTPEEEPESEIDCASHLSASKNRKNVDVDEVEDDKMWASLHPAKSAKHKSI